MAASSGDVVGVWKLASGSATDPAGNTVGVPFGPRGMGLVSLTADGRMILVPPDREEGGVTVRRELAWERISPIPL